MHRRKKRWVSLSLSIALAALCISRAGASSPALCTLTGNISEIWGLSSSTTGADIRVNYQGITGPQNPVGAGGSIVPGSSRCSIYTDANGNLPQTGSCTSFLQGALLYVTIGDGQPTRIQIPFNTSADLSTLILANTDPPGLISSIAIAAGGSYILSVTNPAPGTVGQAVLSPGNVTAFQPTTCSSPSILVGEGNANAVQCTAPDANGVTVGSMAQPTSTSTSAQVYYQVQNDDVSSLYVGIRGSHFAVAGNVPATPDASFMISTASNGLWLRSDSNAINFIANGESAQGAMNLQEDGSGDFTWQPPGSFTVNENANTAYPANIFTVLNTNAGNSAQAVMKAFNGTNYAQMAVLGQGYATASPYYAGEAYYNSSGDMLISAGGKLNLIADGQAIGAALTEDGTGNITWFNSPGALTINSGQTPNFQAVSTNNGSTDIMRVWPQNLTVGLGLWFGGIRMIGSNGSNGMDLDAQGGGVIHLNVNNTSGFVELDSLEIANTGSPTVSSCPNGTINGNSKAQAGQISFSGGSGGSCLINFGATFNTAPLGCTCSAQSTSGQGTACGIAVNTTQVEFFAVIANTGQINWNCLGV